jgi:hypothetical protein
MSNSDYLTQYRVDIASGITSEPEHTHITEPEFTLLLREFWPATNEPRQFGGDNWKYHLRKSDKETEFGEISLIGNSIICETHLSQVRWILLIKLMQKFLKRPLYLWNDSNPADFFEITDSTTERDILLWLDRE